METIIIALISGGAVAAIVSGLFTIIGKKMDRKAAKDDKKDEILSAVQNISKQLDQHIEQSEEQDAKECRGRILRFADEIRSKQRHSYEFFDIILEDINAYDVYCSNHPQFKNSKGSAAKKLITETFDRCIREDSFL